MLPTPSPTPRRMRRRAASLLVLPVLLAGCRREGPPEIPDGPTAPSSSEARADPTPSPSGKAAPTVVWPSAPNRAEPNVASPRATPGSAPRMDGGIAPEVMASARRGEPPARMTQTGETEVKLLGICSYTESAVTCWGPEGASAPKLQPTVDGILRSGYGGSSQFRYGQKNRVLVFSRPRQANVSYRAEDGSENGGYLQSTSVQDSFGPQIEAVFVATFAGRDAGTVTVRTQPYDARPQTRDLAPRAGASVVVDGVGVKITAIRKFGKDEAFGRFGMGAMGPMGGPKGARWLVSLSVDRGKNPEAAYSLAPIGADGQVLRFADDAGKPKGPPKNTPGFPGNYGPGLVNSYRTSDGSTGESVILVVDPQYVKRFSVAVQRASVAQFRDIPLDPRRR